MIFYVILKSKQFLDINIHQLEQRKNFAYSQVKRQRFKAFLHKIFFFVLVAQKRASKII